MTPIDLSNPLARLQGVAGFVYTGATASPRQPPTGTLESRVHELRTLGAEQAAAHLELLDVSDLIGLAFELDGLATSLQTQRADCAASPAEGRSQAYQDFEAARERMLDFQHKHVLALSALIDAVIGRKGNLEGAAQERQAVALLELRITQKNIAECLHERQALILLREQHQASFPPAVPDLERVTVGSDEFGRAIVEKIAQVVGMLGGHVQLAERQALHRMRARIDDCLDQEQLGFKGHLQASPDGVVSLFFSYDPERFKVALDLLFVHRSIVVALSQYPNSLATPYSPTGRHVPSPPMAAVDNSLQNLEAGSRLRGLLADSFPAFNEAKRLLVLNAESLSESDRVALSCADPAIDLVFSVMHGYIAALDDMLGLHRHSVHPAQAVLEVADRTWREGLQSVFAGVFSIQGVDPSGLGPAAAHAREHMIQAARSMHERMQSPHEEPPTFATQFVHSVQDFEPFDHASPRFSHLQRAADKHLGRESVLLVELPVSVSDPGAD